MDDLALASALTKKDPKASRLLVDLHFEPLYRFLKHLTRHKEDAEDLAQQTLIRVVRNAGRYDGRVRLKVWIFSIAVKEYGRLRRRRLWFPLLADAASDSGLADRTADSLVLLNSLARLSPALREAFLLHYVEGLSVEEIATVQSVPPGTVKSRLHTSRLRLRSELEQEEFNVKEPCRS